MKNLTSKNLLLDEKSERQVFYIRRRRYKLFQQTHNLDLIDITNEEWLFLQRKADLYEELTGKDRFLDIFNTYKSCMLNEELLEKGCSYNAFLNMVNYLLKKDKPLSARRVDYFESAHLESILGEDALYDGEKYLLQHAYGFKLKEKLVEYLGSEGYEILNELENNKKPLHKIGEEKGVSRERIRQKKEAAIEGRRCKTSARLKRKYLEEAFDVLSDQEIAELGTTFVKEK